MTVQLKLLAGIACRCVASVFLLSACNGLAAATLLVGPERELKTPGAAARVAQHGDIIRIDAATYLNDYAVWQQNNLVIKGVGGRVHITSDQLIPNRKGLWIVNGDNTLIENIEFSGARVVDTNGAGIRHQGGDLTLRKLYFHHNEFSVLTGRNEAANIVVKDSRFHHQQRSERFSHGIYIGTVGSLTIEGSHFTGTDEGHQIKSRALTNRIRYNRIEDTRNGNSSRLIDLPNCGLSIVLGNDLHQGAGTSNSDVIGYGAEGCEGRKGSQKRLFVLNNTLINEAHAGVLARNHLNAEVIVMNNVLIGAGALLGGRGVANNNIQLPREAAGAHRWSPLKDWPTIDQAVEFRFGDISLSPGREFSPPAGSRIRPRAGKVDLGSREYTGPTPQ